MFAFQGEPQKLCIHCKHYTKDFLQEKRFGKCKLFPREIKNINYLVDGSKPDPQKNHYCSTARDSDDMCGIEGFFFEKK
jgi:hypothetical protein